MSSNNNVKFQKPLYPAQSSAYGFVYGHLQFVDDALKSIVLGDGSSLPLSVSQEKLLKIHKKNIDLSAKCFCGIYPQTTTDNILAGKLSAVFYPHEYTPELCGKFRIRGCIISLELQQIAILVNTSKGESLLVNLDIADTTGFRVNQFIEVMAVNIYGRLVVYEHKLIQRWDTMIGYS